MKILIVDDKAAIRSVMEEILTALGFEDITQAVDGDDAWQKIKQGFKSSRAIPFDLIISDLEMPRMSGLELLKMLRTTRGIEKIPFIMATTITAKQIIVESMRLGVDAYIIKPFDKPMVEFKLKQAGVLP